MGKIFRLASYLYGYDIDGVCTKGIEKLVPYVIISGRTSKEYDELCVQLGLYAPVYIRYRGKIGDRDESANFKAMMINYLEVDEFYEDDDYQATIIRSLCPNCKVIII